MINKAPMNATITDKICFREILSFKNKAEKIMTKKGLSLLSIFASDRTNLSIA